MTQPILQEGPRGDENEQTLQRRLMSDATSANPELHRVSDQRLSAIYKVAPQRVTEIRASVELALRDLPPSPPESAKYE